MASSAYSISADEDGAEPPFVRNSLSNQAPSVKVSTLINKRAIRTGVKRISQTNQLRSLLFQSSPDDSLTKPAASKGHIIEENALYDPLNNSTFVDAGASRKFQRTRYKASGTAQGSRVKGGAIQFAKLNAAKSPITSSASANRVVGLKFTEDGIPYASSISTKSVNRSNLVATPNYEANTYQSQFLSGDASLMDEQAMNTENSAQNAGYP